MKRAFVTAIVSVLAFGAGTAVAGQPLGENDYEGRVKGEDETYFGFDLSNRRQDRQEDHRLLPLQVQQRQGGVAPCSHQG